jgi:hypothetical protein
MPLNIPRLTELADHLDSLPDEKFDLSNWFSTEPGIPLPDIKWDTLVTPGCQTCACIAGETLVLFAPDTPVTLPAIQPRAAELLGLVYPQSEILFVPSEYDQTAEDEEDTDRPNVLPQGWSMTDVKPDQAARVIRHLIETQTVDWRILR